MPMNAEHSSEMRGGALPRLKLGAPRNSDLMGSILRFTALCGEILTSEVADAGSRSMRA